jgi:hypothetical protein
MKIVGKYGDGLLEAVPVELNRIKSLGYDVLT